MGEKEGGGRRERGGCWWGSRIEREKRGVAGGWLADRGGGRREEGADPSGFGGTERGKGAHG